MKKFLMAIAAVALLASPVRATVSSNMVCKDVTLNASTTTDCNVLELPASRYFSYQVYCGETTGNSMSVSVDFIGGASATTLAVPAGVTQLKTGYATEDAWSATEGILTPYVPYGTIRLTENNGDNDVVCSVILNVSSRENPLEDPVFSGNAALLGGATIGNSLGPELLTQTCAGWGLSAPVGASSCSGSTITRTASGSNLTLTNTAAIAGDEYELTFAVSTLTAGTVTISGGAMSCVAVSAARTQVCRVPAGTAGAVTITFGATFAGTIDVSTTGAKKITSEVSSASGPLVINADLTDATENQTAMTLNYVVNKAAGNDTGLEINMIDTASPGTSLPLRIAVNGSTVLSVDQYGDTGSGGGYSSFGRFLASSTASGTSPAYLHTGTQTTWGSIFKDSGTVGAMDGNDTLNIFDAAITNSNHTGTDNEVRAFNAGNITGDAEASEYGLKIGTGWDYPMIAAPPTVQTIAAGNTISVLGACGTMKQITAVGAVTTDTTNTFTAPSAASAGCCFDLVNVGAQNITLDNNALFFSPGAADVVMTGNDAIRICGNGTAWYAVSALVAN